MSRFKIFIYIFFLIQGFYTDSIAYEVETHKYLSKAAYLRSDLASSDRQLLFDLGLIDDINDPDPIFPDESYFLHLTITGRNIRTIEGLIEYGAEFEDDDSFFTEIVRPFNHFYDPQNSGRALTYGLLTGPPVNWPSPDWSLEDNFEVSSQNYSYHDALEYFRNALTSTTKSERDRNWGLVFQTLGQVIHHIQDMAQPQHTRNETHYLDSSAFYEIYTQGVLQSRGALPISGYDIVDLSVFNSPRKFWDQNNGMGLAEFSSNNFVTVGTNFRGGTQSGNIIINAQTHPEFALPDVNDIEVTSRSITDIDLLGPTGPDQPLTGDIQFVGTQVTDAYMPIESRINPRTSSFSLFDSDLEEYNFARTFTLNRFNFDSAQQFLLPRAVAYSAGLINYFFRGRMAAIFTADGNSLEIKNISDPTLVASPDLTTFRAGGSFDVYYQTDAEENKFLMTHTLQSDLAVDATYSIPGFTMALAPIPDMGAEGKVIVLFDGDIGAERGVTVGYTQVTQVEPFCSGPNQEIWYPHWVDSSVSYVSPLGYDSGSGHPSAIITFPESGASFNFVNGFETWTNPNSGFISYTKTFSTFSLTWLEELPGHYSFWSTVSQNYLSYHLRNNVGIIGNACVQQ